MQAKYTTYRICKGESLFKADFSIEALSKMGNPLEQLSLLVDFEMFRNPLEDALLTKMCRSQAGRQPIDVVLLFKIIFLQRYYGLSDHQIQYQIIDGTSFRQLLGIHNVTDVPDVKTVWRCRDILTNAEHSISCLINSVPIWIPRRWYAWIAYSLLWYDSSQSGKRINQLGIQHLLFCANQQISSTAYLLSGVTVS